MASNDHDNDSAVTDIPFIINKDNYKEGIPVNVVDVILSEDVDPSLYAKIFRRGIFSHNDDQLLNVTLPESMTEIPYDAFFFKVFYGANEEDDDIDYNESGCDMIKSIILPPNITKIGNNALVQSMESRFQ